MTENLEIQTTQTGKEAPMPEGQKPESSFRSGFVALVGQPNAGKSTFMNMLLEEKVSIVSPKPQTTRQRITGILNVPEAQVVLVDAPGTLKSTSGINKFLQEEVKDVLDKADVICAFLSADASEDSVKELVEAIRRARKPWVAIITKADILGGTRTPKYFNLLIEMAVPFVAVSALKRPEEARAEFLNRVIPLLPKSRQPLYEEDLYTTQTMRQIAAEFVREACFDNLHQEIPYGLAVRIAEFKEDMPVTRIRAELVIEKENHKAIVIGAKGQTIKLIGSQARAAIEKVLGSQVYLELHVQVKPNWTQNPRMMKELGYVISKN